MSTTIPAAGPLDVIVGPWPAATGDDAMGGWKIAPETLMRVKRNIYTEDSNAYGLDMEQIEAVMLALVRMGLAPNGEVRGASRPAGEASSGEAATSTVVLGTNNGGKNG